jgi:hypothetical protein
MLGTLQVVDVFFIVIGVSVVVATIIGALIGWHVFGIARDAHKVVSAVREEGERVIHGAGAVVEEIMEEKATEIRDTFLKKKPVRRKSSKRLERG